MYNKGDIINNRYHVLSELGRGSYGIVYKVYDNQMEAELAMKSLIIDQNASPAVRKMTETMFTNEYEAGLRIKSPFVIRSYDYFEDRRMPSFTMEFAPGGSYFTRMHEFVNNWDTFNRFAFYFYCGLGDAHRAGVIHRDIKAENILLDDNLHPKITDFGVAHLVKGELIDKLLGKRTKEVIGTEPYLAPEQRNEDTSKRETGPVTDIFAAGVMIYFLITRGRHFPFGVFHKNEAGYSEYILRTKQNGWDNILNYRSDVPAFWQYILDGSLQTECHNRIQSADEIRDILRNHFQSVAPHNKSNENHYKWDELGLKIVVGQNMGKVYSLSNLMTPLNNGLITLGRLDEMNPGRNMIDIEDVSAVVSRRQAVIEYDRTKEKWYLRNGQFVDNNGQKTWLEPPTSTIVNDREIDRFGVEIREGDEIILGKKYLLTVIKFK